MSAAHVTARCAVSERSVPTRMRRTAWPSLASARRRRGMPGFCGTNRSLGYRQSVAATRSIDVRTEIPGPRSKEILERKERVIADPLSIYIPVVIDEARGALLTDVDGNTFVDFTGGVGCLTLGHYHPEIVAAVQEKLARFSHTD